MDEKVRQSITLHQTTKCITVRVKYWTLAGRASHTSKCLLVILPDCEENLLMSGI